MKPLGKRELARLERELIACLTDACETAKAEIVGFTWLTHRLDPDSFPASLRITWVFEREVEKKTALAGEAKARMLALTAKALEEAGVHLEHLSRHVHFDSEQACARSHQGDWGKRLQAH